MGIPLPEDYVLLGTKEPDGPLFLIGCSPSRITANSTINTEISQGNYVEIVCVRGFFSWAKIEQTSQSSS